MTLSRRDFLKLSALVAGSAALSACGSLYAQVSGPSLNGPWNKMSQWDFRLLNRLTFGPTAAERERFMGIGLRNWIEEQLAPDSLDDLDCSLRLRNFDTLDMTPAGLADISDQLFDSVDKRKVPDELRQATLLRQVYSRRQLYESMVEFWSDHFNISIDKGDCFYLKTVDDREVIRRHALGSFRDLVWASVRSPAMLVYLDNQANHKDAPNENYARELMELHTLGVDGGYSQQDVMELARCLTGWTVKEHFWRGKFTFKEDFHDRGNKHVLGVKIDSSGQKEVEQVIDMLVEHPSTARFISTKLIRRFISDNVPVELVEKATAAFERTHGDIPAVLRVILLDGASYLQPKFKRPVNFVASTLRQLHAETDGGAGVQDYLQRMGQPYFGWPTPDGYPDTSERWQGNLMPRWQFVFDLIRNDLEKTSVDLPHLVELLGAVGLPEIFDEISNLLLGRPLDAHHRDEIIASLVDLDASEEEVIAVITGGILASPTFQWR